MRTIEDVLHSLEHHTADELVPNMEGAREEAKRFARFIDHNVPDGRCKAIAYTKLEEVLMWSIKGIVTES